MDKRFNRRLRGVRRAGARPVVALLTALVLVGMIVYLIGFSPALVVKEVVVSGAPEHISTRAVENAEAPMGLPLARVDTSAIAERVSMDMRVDSVEVTREWPSRIELELTTREPVAVLTQNGRRPVLVDEEGIAYERVGSPPSKLVKISAPAGEVSPASLRGALAASSAVAEPWAEEMSRLSVTADGDIRFRVGEIRVQWGPPTETEAKAAALGALLDQEPIDPASEEPLTIDLTAPRTPVVTGLPTLS